MYGFPVGALGPLELLSPLMVPNAGCLIVPVVGFVEVNPPIVRNGVVCAGSLIYRGRLTNLGDTGKYPFSPFVGLGIVRVVGGLLLLLAGWRLLFQNVPRIV